MFKRSIAIGLVTCLIGCSSPTPELYLEAATAALSIVSALPNITPADKVWINDASAGLSCSATVLAKNEAVAQEALDITACFASLPIVPAADQVYITAAIAAVNIFIALYTPTVSPIAINANAKMRSMNASDHAKVVSQLILDAGKAKSIHATN